MVSCFDWTRGSQTTYNLVLACFGHRFSPEASAMKPAPCNVLNLGSRPSISCELRCIAFCVFRITTSISRVQVVRMTSYLQVSVITYRQISGRGYFMWEGFTTVIACILAESKRIDFSYHGRGWRIISNFDYENLRFIPPENVHTAPCDLLLLLLLDGIWNYHKPRCSHY